MDKYAEQPCDIVIFGAKGNLTKKKLLPSLYQLEKMEYMHAHTQIICVGRTTWNTRRYIEIVYQALKSFMQEPLDSEVWKKFCVRFRFCNLDVNESENFNKLLQKLNPQSKTTVYYFAVPSNIFYSICKGLKRSQLNTKKSKIIVEKPIGIDFFSSQKINRKLSKFFREDQIYRIDHYLGKETILDLFFLRFANPLFLTNWNRDTIDHVQITVFEEVGIEKRWNYFDKVGQMRDMVQSHVLQILTIVAMSPPLNLSSDRVRDEKVKVLRALRPINAHSIHSDVVRGQYTKGTIKGKKVSGYLEEAHSDAHSRTETFVAFRAHIDNWRWTNVPFYVRTGKRMPVQMSEVVICFKRPIVNLFTSCRKQCANKIVIRLQPDARIDVDLLHRKPGIQHRHRLERIQLSTNVQNSLSSFSNFDAHTRLLLHGIQGIQSLFVRKDEIEESWKWVNNITKIWDSCNDFPYFYRAGTWGPVHAKRILRQDNRSWNENT